MRINLESELRKDISLLCSLEYRKAPSDLGWWVVEPASWDGRDASETSYRFAHGRTKMFGQ